MKFDELVSRLPGNTGQPTLVMHQGDALNVEPEAVAGYVSPTFSVAAWPPDASVLLIEAPGAVGKSAAAAALASALACPLVRAEKAQVGSYTLSGLVQDALGFTSTYIPEVATGRAAIVVDSLDEAHIKAGTQNFLSFLDNIQSVAGSRGGQAQGPPSVILFSRTDTAELIRLAFLDRALPLAEITLDFFDQAGAEAFIQAYLNLRHQESGRGEYTVHLAYPQPFKRLRNTRFRQLASVLLRQEDCDPSERWSEAEDFLGYTPVLVALAESLAVSNPAREQGTLEGLRDPTELLSGIVNRVLIRERGKFVEQLSSQLAANVSVDDPRDLTADELYTAREQVLRICALVTGNELAVPPPSSLPRSVRDRYEQAAAQFIAEHPFVRNKAFASIVFQDYCLAQVCVDLSARASLSLPPEDRITGVGPFFTHFVAAEMQSSDVRSVPESLVPWLMTSWTQDSELASSVASELRLDYDETAGRLTCVMDGSRVDSNTTLDFDIHDISGALHLRSDCRNVSIASSQGVILGDRGAQLSLGPNFILVAQEVVIEAESLNVEPGRSGTSAVIAAIGTLTANYLTHVTYARETDLRLHGVEPPPRLRPFHRQLVDPRGSFVDYTEFVNLRSILTSFGSSTRGGPSVFCEKLDQAIVKDNAHRRKVLEALIERGVISRDGPLYRLDANAMGLLRFGLADVKNGDPSQPVLQFLRSLHD